MNLVQLFIEKDFYIRTKDIVSLNIHYERESESVFEPRFPMEIAIAVRHSIVKGNIVVRADDIITLTKLRHVRQRVIFLHDGKFIKINNFYITAENRTLDMCDDIGVIRIDFIGG